MKLRANYTLAIRFMQTVVMSEQIHDVRVIKEFTWNTRRVTIELMIR